VLTAWLAVEFGAAVLAIAIVVALGPVVAVLLTGPRDPWLATVAVLSVSLPVAIVLGAAALKSSGELLRQARSG
jgi:membrane protease YdiL (CAAX protease family)